MGKEKTTGTQPLNNNEKDAQVVEEVADETKAQQEDVNEVATDQINDFEIKYNELYDKHLRVLAEYDNYKKRTQKEKEEIYSYAAGDTITQLLPVIDNLERAIGSVEESSPLSEGVQMVLKQFLEILEKLGVTPIEAVGGQFDPNLHNAVMHTEDSDVGANVVVEEFMKGYKHKEKVIRHSMVKVAN